MSGSSWTLIPSNFAVDLQLKRAKHEAGVKGVDTTKQKWQDETIKQAVNDLTVHASNHASLPFETQTMQYGRGMFQPKVIKHTQPTMQPRHEAVLEERKAQRRSSCRGIGAMDFESDSNPGRGSIGSMAFDEATTAGSFDSPILG